MPLQTADTRRDPAERDQIATAWSSTLSECREVHASLPLARVCATLGPDGRPDGHVLPATVLARPFQKLVFRCGSCMDGQNVDCELLHTRNLRDLEENDSRGLS